MEAKNEVSARFIEAYEALLRDNQVNDKRDFAAKLGISASMVTEISKGRSSVGTSAIQNIVLKFNIDAHWLLTGEGNMLVEEGATYTADTPQQPSSDTNSAQMVDKMLDMAKEIGRLQEQVRHLTAELEKTASRANTATIANAG